MNTQDLRYIKTERLLTESYFELIQTQHKPIRINALCEKALINKTTFYKHYGSMEQFEAHVCKEYVSKVIRSLPVIRQPLDNIEERVRALYEAFAEKDDVWKCLFSDNPQALLDICSSVLLEIHQNDPGNTADLLSLEFAIAGAAKVLSSHKGEAAIQKTILLMQKVLENGAE